MNFRNAEESVSKQQYYEQAVLLSEALTTALGAVDLAIEAIEVNHPEHPYLFGLKQWAVQSRAKAKQAMKKTEEQ